MPRTNLPAVPGKAHAVVGMRRSGKTTGFVRADALARDAVNSMLGHLTAACSSNETINPADCW